MIGPILYAVAVYAIMIVCMWLCFKLGYSKGGDAIVDMMAKGTLNRIMNAAGIVGCCVMGGLIVNYVHIACALDFFIGKTRFNIQTTLFDAICPNLLPLLLTLACVAGLRKGKKSPDHHPHDGGVQHRVRRSGHLQRRRISRLLPKIRHFPERQLVGAAMATPIGCLSFLWQEICYGLLEDLRAPFAPRTKVC